MFVFSQLRRINQNMGALTLKSFPFIIRSCNVKNYGSMCILGSSVRPYKLVNTNMAQLEFKKCPSVYSLEIINCFRSIPLNSMNFMMSGHGHVLFRYARDSFRDITTLDQFNLMSIDRLKGNGSVEHFQIVFDKFDTFEDNHSMGDSSRLEILEKIFGRNSTEAKVFKKLLDKSYDGTISDAPQISLNALEAAIRCEFFDYSEPAINNTIQLSHQFFLFLS